MKKGISLSQRLKLREENSWCSQWWWTSFVWIPSNRNKIVFLSCWFLLLRLEMIRLVLSNHSWEKVVVLPFLFHWWNLSTFWSDSITFFDIFWNQLWNIKCKINISTWWKCLVFSCLDILIILHTPLLCLDCCSFLYCEEGIGLERCSRLSFGRRFYPM